MDKDKVLSNIPCGVIVLNDNMRIKYANERILALCGRDIEDVIEQDISIFGINSDKKDGVSFSKERCWNLDENEIIHHKSSLLDISNNKTPIFISGKRHKNSSGISSLYLCILDTSNLEEWAIIKESSSKFKDHFHGLVGKSPEARELYSQIEMASATGVNVVIQGESGTGKELVASAIHYASARHNHPFVRVNCAALAENLLESELFGHVKGAFTGAYRDRKGTFETAHKGTILLDEIGETTLAMQAKLLRVLQEKIVIRVGDNREISVDVRIIAATNKNLRRRVQEGLFREDLFYRLNVFPIHVPSLSERRPDIMPLCTHFLKKYRREIGKNILSISADAMHLLLSYCWPGNIRELENTIEHAFVLCKTEEIAITDFPYELRIKGVREGICAERSAEITSQPDLSKATVEKISGRLNITKEQLEAELNRHGGNKSATARSLGISKVGLWKKMKKMGWKF